jgi:hypothetical protein
MENKTVPATILLYLLDKQNMVNGMFLLLCNITTNNEFFNHVTGTAHLLVLGGQLNGLHLLHNALHSNCCAA